MGRMRYQMCWLGVLVVVVLLWPGGLVYGQAKVGTTGAQFLELGVSARADAMGGSFTALADDASAVYYNPAGLVQLERREAMLTHIEMPAGITYDFVGVAWPLDFGGVLGFGGYGLSAGDIPVTTYKYPNGTPGWTFGAKDYALGLSYGRYLTDRFSVGVTWKFISELYEEESSLGWAADVGTNYNTGFRNFRITMVISNFGPDMKFISQGYALPINFRFGGAIDMIDGLRHRATLALEGSHPSDNLEKYSMGVEYGYNDVLLLRAGNRFGEGDDASARSGWSFGGGVNLNLGEMAARVDYGYQDFGVLSEIHRFSVTFGF